MDDWEKFYKNILEEAQLVIGRDFEKNKNELGEASWNQLFDTGGPTTITKKSRKDDLYFGKIFHGFIEIDSSIRTLRDIEIYISSFPYKNKTITKPRHLRYHIESYFNEVYILKERLNAYLTTVGRCFKGDRRQANILQNISPVFQVVKNSFGGVVDIRGRHVHRFRFDHKDLDRLETMELLVVNRPGKMSQTLRPYYEFTYKDIRRKWKKIIKDNNDQTIQLLHVYGRALNGVLFNARNGRLKYPRPTKLFNNAPRPTQ